jgi:hypothetical protein
MWWMFGCGVYLNDYQVGCIEQLYQLCDDDEDDFALEAVQKRDGETNGHLHYNLIK